MGDLKQLCPQEVCLASVQHASHAFTVSSASEASFFTFAFTRRSAVQLQKTSAYVCMQNMKGSPLRSLSFVGKGTPLQRCARGACMSPRSSRTCKSGQIWTAEVEKKDIERLLSKASLAFTGCFVRYATERTRQTKNVKNVCVCAQHHGLLHKYCKKMSKDVKGTSSADARSPPTHLQSQKAENPRSICVFFAGSWPAQCHEAF